MRLRRTLPKTTCSQPRKKSQTWPRVSESFEERKKPFRSLLSFRRAPPAFPPHLLRGWQRPDHNSMRATKQPTTSVLGKLRTCAFCQLTPQKPEEAATCSEARRNFAAKHMRGEPALLGCCWGIAPISDARNRFLQKDISATQQTYMLGPATKVTTKGGQLDGSQGYCKAFQQPRLPPKGRGVLHSRTAAAAIHHPRISIVSFQKNFSGCV